MRIEKKHKSTLLLFTLFASFYLNSCVSNESLIYLKGNTNDKIDKYEEPSYILRPKDILSIRLNSLESNTATYFNEEQTNGGGGGLVNNTMLYLSGYIVDKKGNIKLPLVGEVAVAGKTLDDVKEDIDTKLEDYLKFASVSVKLVNFRVTLLGEVKMPGQYYVYEEKVTLLQAVSLAGGLTQFANNKKVKLIREGFNENEAVYLDLSNDSIIQSDKFFLMPNDIIYIEPTKAKALSINLGTAGLLVSVVSVVALITNVILSNSN